MADAALNNAEAQRKQLVERKRLLMAELMSIDDQLGQIDRFVKAWHLFAEGSGNTESGVAPANLGFIGNETPQTRTRRNSTKEEVATGARDIIREFGAPVSRSTLFAELRKRGFIINGKNPEMVLSTMLWRMRDRVVRLKDGGYWLADEENPEIGYRPIPPEVQAEAERLAGAIKVADHSYHSEDSPTISDQEYDDLRRRLNEIRSMYPLLPL